MQITIAAASFCQHPVMLFSQLAVCAWYYCAADACLFVCAKHQLPHAVFVQVAVVNKFDLPYEVIGRDRKSRLRIMPRVSRAKWLQLYSAVLHNQQTTIFSVCSALIPIKEFPILRSNFLAVMPICSMLKVLYSLILCILQLTTSALSIQEGLMPSAAMLSHIPSLLLRPCRQALHAHSWQYLTANSLSVKLLNSAGDTCCVIACDLLWPTAAEVFTAAADWPTGLFSTDFDIDASSSLLSVADAAS